MVPKCRLTQADVGRPPAIDGLTDPLVGLSDADWEFTLTTLRDARLVSVNRAEGTGELLSLDAHPLIREYFAVRLRNVSGTSEAYRAAHRRLYEHLCETTKEGDQPTLEDLQPLYQAVAHGCRAGLVQEACDDVYIARILREREAYSTFKLGAIGSDLGAIACFFDRPWDDLSPLLKTRRATILNEAAFSLRALGRLPESVEPMRAGLRLLVSGEDWKSAGAMASNLSELELTLGDVSGAVSDAERSVTYADRSGDAGQRMINRTTYADALHQSGGDLGFQSKSAAGSHSPVESLFREAEQMQAEHQPTYPLLYCLQGFRYCDLLLAPAERQAWQRGTGFQPVSEENHGQDGRATCRDVTDRATQTLKWMIDNKMALLDIALDHLTLARASLYEAILSADSSSSFILPPVTSFDSAASGLRSAGQMDELPRGLLTRAWYRGLSGGETGRDSARSDLNEAWENASRGPMPLFLADIHLHRARLFGVGPVPTLGFTRSLLFVFTILKY